jgi:hypothetical protein
MTNEEWIALAERYEKAMRCGEQDLYLGAMAHRMSAESFARTAEARIRTAEARIAKLEAALDSFVREQQSEAQAGTGEYQRGYDDCIADHADRARAALDELAKAQEPLGAEFEDALWANKEGLYEP